MLITITPCVEQYAYGMCVLEIITREVPYEECLGVFGKIAERVLQASPPDALSGVLNPLARQFIEACITARGERGGGSRPSAAELLTHEFLAEDHADDDDEVTLGG